MGESLTFDGLLVLDKPAGITSRDAVDRAVDWFSRKTKIGHTGTLDPFATGVLVLCLGSATRLAEYVQRMNKTYHATFVLGATSDTDDIDGTITQTNADDPGRNALMSALSALVGTLEQVPPAFSAAKVSGRRAYHLARQGEEVELKARRVQVYGIDLLRYEWPQVEVTVRCGKGTYIRSLARDAGQALGCGAYVSVLRRTHVGPFAADDAVSLDADRLTARARLLPLEMALADLPRVMVSTDEARQLSHGQSIASRIQGEGEVAVFGESGGLVGVATTDPRGSQLRPAKVLV